MVFPPPATEINVEELINAVRLPPTATRLVTTRGELLTDHVYRGKQYNRGIFVSECAKGKCLFGYNFYDPDKTLLDSRDRNSHNKDACLKECGSILSEAILADPAVRVTVLQDALIHQGAITATGVTTLTVFEDLKTGEFITEEARVALRAAHCASLLASPATAIFCGNATDEVKRVAEAQNLAVVHCHLILHNHASEMDRFFTRLAEEQQELPAGSVLVEKKAQVLELLGAVDVQQSRALGDERVGF